MKSIVNISELDSGGQAQAWSDAAMDFSRVACVHELFETQAAITPEAEAIVANRERLSYAELNTRANQLAHYLLSAGAGPEILIGIYLEQSVEMAVAIVAVLKTGAAYLPLDPRYPASRLEYMVKDAGVGIVIARDQFAAGASLEGIKVVSLSSSSAAIARQSCENPQTPADPKNLALVVYTSGSTGQPKGVMITHEGLVNIYHAYKKAYGLGDCVFRFAQTTAFSFGVFHTDFVRALCSGGTLVLFSPDVVMTPHQLYDSMVRENVDFAEFVPPVLRYLLRYLEETGQTLFFLKMLIVGSDRWHLWEHDRLGLFCAPETRILNSFGGSETTIDATYFDGTQVYLQPHELAPVGRCFENVRVYVLDQEMKEVPGGEEGEIFIGGPGVARGYWQRPALTAEKFVPDPFSSEAGLRLYSTGDLGRYLVDGNLQFVGRRDHQVKVHGFRIELAEVEAAMVAHPLVREAVATTHKDSSGENYLVGYFVPKDDAGSTVTEMRRFLKTRLPDHMVPASFCVLENLPLTPSGKVDRKSLPIPNRQRPELEAKFIAPRNPVEAVMAGIWEEILQMDRVGVEDDFFELGGHSLLATRLISKVRAAFEAEVTARDLFDAPTVAGLTKRLQKSEKRRAPLAPAARPACLPLSYAQRRLWFIDQLEGTSTQYNMPEAFHLLGALDVVALKRAFNAIVKRHEGLRTCFPQIDGEPVQIINPALKIDLPLHHLTSLDESAQREHIFSALRQEWEQPFDLSHGPLLRTKLLKLSDQHHVLVRTFHHIVSDGWSEDVFDQELATLYAAFIQGEENSLQPLAVQYADFTLWQRGCLNEEAVNSDLAYWKNQLAGIGEQLELPQDRPRPARQSFSGGVVRSVIPAEQVAAIKELGQATQTSLYMVLLSAYAILIERYSGQNDIVIGSPIANRQEPQLEELIGFFVNPLAMRVRVDSEHTFQRLVSDVRRMALGAYQHQDLPFERLVEELSPQRSLNTSPIFQVTFTLHTGRTRLQQLAGLKIEPVISDDVQLGFDLEFHAFERDGQIELCWFYKHDLFDPWRIEQMSRHYLNLLQSAISTPDVPLRQLNILNARERRELIDGLNPRFEPVVPATVASLFEVQAARTPEAVAVVFEEQHLTYAALNRRANQVAHHLRSLGVGPEMAVALCLERSLEMVVGILGILKADGVYVPLDPQYPMERLAFMLRDSQAPIILTQERLAGSLPASWAQIICLDSEWEQIQEQDESTPARNAAPENSAYLIYTSGSTGWPKGVVATHSGAVNLAFALMKAFEIDQQSRVLQFASSSFDAAVSEWAAALLSGACLVLASREALAPGNDLLETLRRERITVVTLPPSVLATLPKQELPELKTLVVAGEACRSELASEWSAGRRMINAYGPTEGTVCATISAPLSASEKITIGRPMTNVSIYVLGADMQPMPVGVSGELLIGGSGVTRGYLNRPDLTAEKFVPHPFSENPGQRLYRTGDLARWRIDGTIEYLGRADQQVKVRGFRIEPGEIEAILREHADVSDAVVVAREDVPGQKRLVAYVVSGESPQAKPEFWPSVAEYFVYDELLYLAMINDIRRNDAYRTALAGRVRGKVVIDVGTGPEAILARMCVECGAERVYAIEYLEETYRKAAQFLGSHGLNDRITLIHGDAREVVLPEKADVCVSELVGPVGSMEGVVPILNGVWRLLKPDAVMIPQRSITRIAAVSLPPELALQKSFSGLPRQYVHKIFEQVGHPFDLRLCVRNFPASALLSSKGIFEDLDSSGPMPLVQTQEIDLEIQKSGELDGFLLWLYLIASPGAEIDILENEHCWLPVYLPVFAPGLRVQTGDRIIATCTTAPSANGHNPDYFITGFVRLADGTEVSFSVESRHASQSYGATALHRQLLMEGMNESAKPAETMRLTGEAVDKLRQALRSRLPEHMVPSAFVQMRELPLTPNGKLDRKGLPAPEGLESDKKQKHIAPRTPAEEILCAIWGKVLGVEDVGVTDNFFALGGDSILSIQVVAQARKMGLEFSVRQIFESPTIHALAQVATVTSALEEASGAAATRIAPFSLLAEEDRAKLPEDVEDGYPLSRLQAGMLFYTEYSPESPLYYNISSHHIQARLDVALLEQAVKEVVARHEVLRTSFHLGGYSQPLQLVHREAEIGLAVEDLSELSLAEQEEALRQWMEVEKGRSFDVTRPGLLRFQIHKRSEEGFQFTKTEHHVILDGWSEALLLTELFTCYFALLQGKEKEERQELLKKEEAGSKFNEFIRLEQEALESEEARRFWERQLAEVNIARMPWRSGSKVAGKVQTCSLDVEIGEELSAGLKGVARQAGVSVKSVLLAAHVRVMSLLSGEREVVTGLVSNGRAESSGGERILGVFLNTLPLRMELAGGRWMDLVEQTTAAEKAMLPYRRYPLLDLQRMAGGMELFDVAFNFIHFHVYRELEHLGRLQILDSQAFGQTNFALQAHFAMDAVLSKIQLMLDYNAAQIDPEQAASIGRYYLNALRAIAHCPEGRYDIASLLEEQERRQILTAWNHTSRAVPAVCLPHLLEAQAEATPQATAVIFGEQSLTYRQLHEQANRLAHHLLGLGIGPETRVGIALERSMEMVVALLGTLKAGAAYLPLDLDYPQARLEQMLADAEPAVIVSLQSHRHRLPASTSVLALDEDETQKLLAEAAASHPQDRQRSCSLHPWHPAYVIYTSGSTGTPKGAVVSHAGIVNRLLWMQAEYGLKADDRVLQKTPFSFDVSVWEFFWPLLAGATLVMAEPGGHRDPAYLAALIQQAGVTTVHFVPSMLEAFIQEPKAAGCRGLRRVICSGEALSAELQAEFYKILPVPLHNLYGPTEASVDVSYWACPVNAGAGLVPIGRPIWNTQLYVLDESLQAVPVGVVGELYIGGTGLGRGYLKRAGLTAQRFVADPYSQGGARMYRTGDVARWRTDGVLEFLGRNDHQVKVRGFRIELEEIESALRASGEVAQAVVVASGERLVGYVVGAPGRVVEAEQLQQRLRQKLPEYMVPAAVVVLESLPLTANGKLDRKALPQPEIGEGQQWRGPSTSQEEELCAIFGEVLGVERVSVDASFFALGGHSLLAMRLVRTIESRLGWKLTLRNIFDSPTVAQLARLRASYAKASAVKRIARRPAHA